MLKARRIFQEAQAVPHSSDPPHITSVLCDLILGFLEKNIFGPDCTLDLTLFGIVLSSQMGFEMAHTFNCMIKEANTFNEPEVKNNDNKTRNLHILL